MTTIDFVIPSVNQELTYFAVKSFEKYKGNFDFRYIIIESSSDSHLKSKIEDIGNVVWIQDDDKKYPGLGPSTTLCIAIEKYSSLVTSDAVFICDNDVVATHPEWMDAIYKKYNEGFSLVGTSITEARLFSTQKCGFLCSKFLFDNVSLFPNIKNGSDGDQQHSQIRDPLKWYPNNEPRQWDTGDLFHEYCRKNEIKTHTLRCSLNDPSINEILPKPFKDFHVDRTINDDNEVIYMHLGRGMAKIKNVYSKPNRVYYPEWKNFIETFIIN